MANAECIINGFKNDDGFSKRLIQMGVLPGAHLKIIRVGPLGNTVEVMIDEGQNIALRINELKQIDCQLIAVPLLALSDSTGKKFRILKFIAGKGFIQKLEERNLNISDVIEILDSFPFRLKVEDRDTITVGRGESEKIIVEPIDDD